MLELIFYILIGIAITFCMFLITVVLAGILSKYIDAKYYIAEYSRMYNHVNKRLHEMHELKGLSYLDLDNNVFLNKIHKDMTIIMWEHEDSDTFDVNSVYTQILDVIIWNMLLVSKWIEENRSLINNE